MVWIRHGNNVKPMERYGPGTTAVSFHTQVLLTRVSRFRYCCCIYGFVTTVSHLCLMILPFSTLYKYRRYSLHPKEDSQRGNYLYSYRCDRSKQSEYEPGSKQAVLKSILLQSHVATRVLEYCALQKSSCAMNFCIISRRCTSPPLPLLIKT